MENMEWYMTVSQAAEMLGCHRREIGRLLQRGRLMFIRMPDGAIKVSEHSVWQYLRYSDDYGVRRNIGVDMA